MQTCTQSAQYFIFGMQLAKLHSDRTRTAQIGSNGIGLKMVASVTAFKPAISRDPSQAEKTAMSLRIGTRNVCIDGQSLVRQITA